MQTAITTSVCDFTRFIFFDRCSPRLFLDLSAAARVEYMHVVLVDVVATADKREEGIPLVCPSVAQTSPSMAADQRVTISWLSVQTAALQSCLFRGLSAAARIEYVLVVLVDVVATAEMRGEGGPLVCPSVAQMTLSMTSTQVRTLSGFGSEPQIVSSSSIDLFWSGSSVRWYV